MILLYFLSCDKSNFFNMHYEEYYSLPIIISNMINYDAVNSSKCRSKAVMSLLMLSVYLFLIIFTVINEHQIASVLDIWQNNVLLDIIHSL